MVGPVDIARAGGDSGWTALSGCYRNGRAARERHLRHRAFALVRPVDPGGVDSDGLRTTQGQAGGEDDRLARARAARTAQAIVTARSAVVSVRLQVAAARSRIDRRRAGIG